MKTNYSNEEIFSMQRELDEKKKRYELDGVICCRDNTRGCYHRLKYNV